MPSPNMWSETVLNEVNLLIYLVYMQKTRNETVSLHRICTIKLCVYIKKILNLFLIVSLICNGPVKFLCLGSEIILNYYFNFECAQSCSKHILICSMRIQNMARAALITSRRPIVLL